MLRIRDDDILVRSSSWSDPVARFKQIHEWIRPHVGQVIHVPAILVSEIQEFPDCIEYIKENVANGTMETQIHGYQHIEYSRLGLPFDRLPARGAVDYTIFSQEELHAHFQAVRLHLAEAKEWVVNTFECNPSIWYTPW